VPEGDTRERAAVCEVRLLPAGNRPFWAEEEDAGRGRTVSTGADAAGSGGVSIPQEAFIAALRMGEE
jgi:hypothetical protein